MKKTIKIFWLICLVLLACTLVLTGCDEEEKPNDTNDDVIDDGGNEEHVHAFGDWVVAKEATCTDDGEKERTCKCGEKETSGIEALGHTFVDGFCVCGVTNLPASTGLNYELSWDGKSYVVTGKGSCTDNVIVIPSTYNDLPVTSISKYAFEECSELTNVAIGNNITSIGESAFYGCNGLVTIIIPDSVTSIGDSAFVSCNNLASLTIGNSVTSIGDGAFSVCSSLTSLNIPDSVMEIGNGAFSSCSSLTSVTIGKSVWVIGEHAFSDCISLTSVTIPDSVKTIHSWAFSGCDNLTTITYAGTKAQWNEMLKEYGWNHNIENYTVYCSDATTK